MTPLECHRRPTKRSLRGHSGLPTIEPFVPASPSISAPLHRRHDGAHTLRGYWCCLRGLVVVTCDTLVSHCYGV